MSKWIEEELEPGLRASYGLRRVLNSCTSKWQSVDVVELECFGRTLMIDGLIQVLASVHCLNHGHTHTTTHPPPSTTHCSLSSTDQLSPVNQHQASSVGPRHAVLPDR